MNMANIIFSQIKLKIKNEIGFKEVDLIKFKINYIQNSFQLIAEGKKESSSPKIRFTGEEQDLKNNSGFSRMLTKQLKKKIIFDELNYVYLTVDFLNKTSEAEMYFIKDNKKQTATEKNIF